jgi:hypothetical protein
MHIFTDEKPTIQRQVFFGKLLDSIYEDFRVNNHTVCNYTNGIRSDRTAWQQVQGKLGVAYDNGMSGVGPAAVAHNDVAFLSKDIYNFAFSLVTPL